MRFELTQLLQKGVKWLWNERHRFRITALSALRSCYKLMQANT